VVMATPMATLSAVTDISRMGKVASLGQTGSGWRDLNSRPLDPQCWAKRPLESALVRLPWSDAGLYPGGRWRKPLNASQLLQSLLHQALKGGHSKITK
jgi:hypothetical protein